MSDVPTIAKPWRTVTLMLWLMMAVANTATFTASIGLRFRELTMPCTPPSCTDPMFLTAQDMGVLERWGVPVSTYAAYGVALDILAFMALAGLSILILSRRRNEWIMMITALVMMAGSVAVVSYTSGAALMRAHPIWLLPISVLNVPSLILVGVLLFTFPNGRFFPRSAWILPVAATVWLVWVVIVNPAALVEQSAPFVVIPEALYVMPGMLAQGVRYFRISTPLERQQTKVVLLFFAMGSLSLFGPLALTSLVDPTSEGHVLAALISNTVLVLLTLASPIGMTLGILRYRLWDIDFVIRRTLTYGIITTLLAGTYVGVVALLQHAFVQITGEQSALAIVISTLGIAALFTPVRRRVQDFLDRRFNRSRYNAEQTLEDFIEAMRDEVDMDHLSAALVGVVEETMQPESVGLWLAATSPEPYESQEAGAS